MEYTLKIGGLQVIDELFIDELMKQSRKFRIKINGLDAKKNVVDYIKGKLDSQNKKYLYLKEILNYPVENIILYCNYHEFSKCYVFYFREWEPRLVYSNYDHEFFGQLYLFMPCDYSVGI